MSHSHKLDQVVKLIGHTAAIKLVRLKGGQETSFPKASNLHDLHWLVVEVGLKNAQKLCIEYEGATLKLPIEVNALLQLRRDAIAEEFKKGSSVSQLACKYEIDRKLVQSYLDCYGLRGKLKTDEEEQAGVI